MSNRPYKNVKRLVENISKDVVNKEEIAPSGGGVEKVEQLPEIGKSNTIYELVEKYEPESKKFAYMYAFTEYGPSYGRSVYMIDSQSKFDAVTFNELNHYDSDYIYDRETDKISHYDSEEEELYEEEGVTIIKDIYSENDTVMVE